MPSKLGWLVACLLLVAAAVTAFFVSGPRTASAEPPVGPGDRIEFALLFGYRQLEPARWDGAIDASGARIAELRGWRFDDTDAIQGSSWKLATRRVTTTWGVRQLEAFPALENGVYVVATLLDSKARFSVRTANGNFSFTARDLAFGKPLLFLDGLVSVEQVPVTTRLSDSIEEQDFPSLAVTGEKAYLTYVEFTHGDRSQKWKNELAEKPLSFEPLRRPAGGDQVFLREYLRSSGTWSQPVAISDKDQDVYRTAVAVDGGGRVWVVWSAQVDGNFDLYARSGSDGHWSGVRRLTRDPGPDLNPVATTASDGAVWVAWQGYRKSFDILAVRQQGDGFSNEQTVSFSEASDWAPQIAAGPSGEVAVSWDTYDKGDYDVYVRRLRHRGSIKLEAPQAIAGSPLFEARSTLSYDAGGRLWVAYEESFRAWGKDYGSYETSGAGLYLGNTVRVRILDGGRLLEPIESLDSLLEKHPPTNPLNRGPQRRPRSPFRDRQPDPELAQSRKQASTPYPFAPETMEGFPRLGTDASGNVFLVYRTSAGGIWGPLGAVWFEHLARFNGKSWTGPVFLSQSDGILDQRPALATLGYGRLLIVGTTDHRFTESAIRGFGAGQEKDFDYDLMAWDFSAEKDGGKVKLKEIAAEKPTPRKPEVKRELEQVAMMRDYRVRLGDQALRLLRGEFHRHTSISGDGGYDGDIIDAFRYMLDAAYMDWAGCCDHDNGSGREYTWWLTQKMTDAFHLQGRFVTLFNYERSVRYPEGHRNVLFAQRGIRPLPRLPKTDPDSPPNPAPDTQMLFDYLRQYGGVAAVHTSGTNMGTDWRDNDPVVEPFVEIYQGDRQNYEIPGAPRANSEDDSIGGWRPLGFVSNALDKGYRLAFQASSDHLSTHMSYCNIWVTEPTRDALVEAIKKRRVYGATENILADVRCFGHFMGEEFSLERPPQIEVKLIGTSDFAKVHIIKDGSYVYSVEPRKREVSFTWQDSAAEKGKTSYYYVRGEQSDGEIVWVSPMWIRML